MKDKPSGAPKLLHISIVPPRNPQRMPLWNWFGAETPDLDWWTARGFNGFRFGMARDPLVDGSTANNFARILDDGTRRGLDTAPIFIRRFRPNGPPNPKRKIAICRWMANAPRKNRIRWSRKFWIIASRSRQNCGVFQGRQNRDRRAEFARAD